MLLPVPVVVFQLVALVLQCIEGLVLDLPAAPADAHQFHDVVAGNGAVGHPAEAQFPPAGPLYLLLLLVVHTLIRIAAQLPFRLSPVAHSNR